MGDDQTLEDLLVMVVWQPGDFLNFCLSQLVAGN